MLVLKELYDLSEAPVRACPRGGGLHSQVLCDLLMEAGVQRRPAEILGVERLGAVIQLGMGVAGLFVSPLAAGAAVLLASVGETAADQEGVVACVGRAMSVSVSGPVVVVIDDADYLESDLAIALVENLIERPDGRVLVVLAIEPHSDLIAAPTSRAKYGRAGRVHKTSAHIEMAYHARADLAAELCPGLPGITSRRIGYRVPTFADVFAAASSPDRFLKWISATTWPSWPL